MSAASIAVAPSAADAGRVRRIGRFAKDAVAGTLFASNPLTAVIVLGWLMRQMAWIAGVGGSRPGWIFGSGTSLLSRSIGGLWGNLAYGLGGLATLGILTLPLTSLWTLAWWAGWENSFNKGYEQATVGPLLSFAVIALMLPALSYLPMALAHQAAAGSWRAFFAWRHNLGLISKAGWRYVFLTLITAVLAVPIMAFRVLPLFIANNSPRIAEMTAQEVGGVRLLLTLSFSAYVFLTLWLLRSAAMRSYQRAVEDRTQSKLHWMRDIVGWAVMLAANLMLVAQIYIAQFFNHGWSKWMTHPYFLLPMAN